METTQPPESAQGPTPIAPAPPAPPESSAPPMPPAPPAQAASAPPPNFGGLLKRAFHIWKAQWWKMVVLNAIPGLVIVAGIGLGAAVMKLLPLAATPILGVIILAVFLIIAWLGPRVAAAQIRLALGADARIGMGEAWRTSKGMAWSLALITVLTALVVSGGYILIIPGIIWALSFIFAPYVRVQDGVRGRDALVRSRQLVKGDWWWVFWRTFIFGLLIILMSAPFFVLGLVFKSDIVVSGVFRTLGGIVNMLFITPLALGFMTAMFESLWSRKSANLVPMPNAKKVYTLAAVGGVLLPIILVVALWGMIAFMFRLMMPSRSANDANLMKLRVDPAALEIQTDDSLGSTEESGAAPKMPAQDDLDNDGLYDPQERTSGDTDPTNPDTDGDGLGDGDEYLLGTWADLVDSDGDGFNDGDEIVNGFDPSAPGQPLPEETRALLIDRYQKGELHEPTITTLRSIFPQ